MTSTENPPVRRLDDLSWWTQPVADRDAYFARLRAEDPRPFVPPRREPGSPRHDGFWALLTYEDVREVSRREEDFCSGQGTQIFDQPPRLREYRGSIIDMDNPEHVRLRKIVNRGFTPKSLEKLREDVRRIARDLIASVAERGECDFVTDVAGPLPLRIVNDMLGIPDEYEKYIFDQTNIIMGASDPEYIPDQSPRSVAAAVEAAGEGLAELLSHLAEDRIASPRDDLISKLVAAQGEEVLTPGEMARFFILLVGAGNETTRNAISHGLLALTRYPDQRELWRSDLEAHTAPAVEEVVRWASPVLHFRRTVTRDGVRLGDQEFAEGDKVVMWYRSANQDESAFPDGTRFDITRKPNPHVGFGAPGPHFCLGANLARLELGVVFQELLTLLPDIRAVGEPEFLRSNLLHGVKHLRAEFTPTSVVTA
ncbi:cytochrome P450 [Trujillonella humicola]|uniref:cytochrome P450 n=1 Tax=Trujillonella humicola TaxID=3383699 RepID=UPI0039058CD7